MEDTGNTLEELRLIFNHCQPNKDGLISLKNLQALFAQQSNQDFESLAEDSGLSDEWISFEDFCQGVDSFLAPNSKSPAPPTSMNEGETIATLPTDPFDLFRNNSAAEAASSIQTHSNDTSLSISTETPSDTSLIDFPPIEDTLIDFTQSPPSGSNIKIPKLVLPQEDLMNMSEVLTTATTTDPRVSSPQSDSAMGGSDTSQTQPNDSSFSDEKEENFESYGENEDVEYEPDLPDFDEVDVTSPRSQKSRENASNFVRRNAWTRTSLRRSPATQPTDQLVPPRRWGSFRHSNKRVGSNALASALYYNNGGTSFNSSGRSSNCDEDDMQSNISLEEDVNDLNQKVQMLQEQVGHLAESQATTDDRYSKVKQENQTLTQKVHMLEEHIRELELQSQERLIEEQKRNKDLLQRLEREKTLEIENYAIRLQNAEREQSSSTRDLTVLRSQVDRLKTEKSHLEQELFETQQNNSLLIKERSRIEDTLKKTQEQLEKERTDNSHLVEELTRELDAHRLQLQKRSEISESEVIRGGEGKDAQGIPLSNEISRIKELESEVKSLREEARKLGEEKEDLQAQVINGSVIAGQNVLQTAASMSIADELNDLSEQQDFPRIPTAEEFTQIRNALKEQQEVNTQLRDYIDGILTNIIMQHPELLEVKK